MAEILLQVLLGALEGLGLTASSSRGLRVWGCTMLGVVLGCVAWLACTPHAIGVVALVVAPLLGLGVGCWWPIRR